MDMREMNMRGVRGSTIWPGRTTQLLKSLCPWPPGLPPAKWGLSREKRELG